MILRKLTLALSAVALSFSVSAFAQQTAPQPDQQAPTNPAGEVIGKLATMGHDAVWRLSGHPDRTRQSQ